MRAISSPLPESPISAMTRARPNLSTVPACGQYSTLSEPIKQPIEDLFFFLAWKIPGIRSCPDQRSSVFNSRSKGVSLHESPDSTSSLVVVKAADRPLQTGKDSASVQIHKGTFNSLACAFIVEEKNPGLAHLRCWLWRSPTGTRHRMMLPNRAPP